MMPPMAGTLITLDASNWSSPDDFYAELLPRLGAIAGHGHNLAALEDGLGTELMAVRPPFAVRIDGTANLGAALLAHLQEAVAVFEETRREYGDDISLTLAGSLSDGAAARPK
jgi:hypothetical protein